MRALRYARFGPPEVLEVVELDEPVPRAGEFKVRVRAASLNPLDVKVRAGHLRLMPGFDRPPRGTGVDFAGEIVGTGGAADGAFPGMRVFGSLSPFRRAGSFAEYVCVTQDRFAPIPDTVSDADAAALPVAAGTAVQALADHARLASGMRVLVIGAAGGVGHFAVQYAHHVGAHVTATCGPGNVAFVASLGADVVLDYTREDAARADLRYDVVFDVAGRSSWRAVRNVLDPAGVYLNTSGDARAVVATLGETLGARLAGRQRVVGLVLKGGAEAWRRLAKLAASKALIPHLRATIGLADVAEAQREMEAGHGRGKVVVDPTR
jgi:NADPH:quinone reductase-like Zn-dependent oxidoreductase